VRAGTVVLATGDCSFRGQYAGVDAATGDGAALALAAGARLANMEFLCVNTGPAGYGFEGTGIALRFGGVFRNAQGEAFMGRYHPDGDAAEVAHLVRAMALEAEAGRAPVRLDLSAAVDEQSFLRIAFSRMGGFMPLNLARMSDEGADVFAEPLEWEPAIQTLRGGVRTELDGSTDVAGLFAAGMAQAFDPGLFNGWSSMRAMWSGQRAGVAAAEHVLAAGGATAAPPSSGSRAEEVRSLAHAALRPFAGGPDRGPRPDDVLADLQDALFVREVCLRKTPEALSDAMRRVQELGALATGMSAGSPHELVKVHETANMLRTAELFLRGSLLRRESRGDHQRADAEQVDDDRWLCWINQHLVVAAGGEHGRETVVDLESVPLARYRFGPAPSIGGAGDDRVGETAR
jgi:succinate dehydrogenase/fumarate reductase flavoprotein subunit